MSADADAVCGAGYRQRSLTGGTFATATGAGAGTPGPAASSWRCRSCGRAATFPTGCSSGAGGPSRRSSAWSPPPICSASASTGWRSGSRLWASPDCRSRRCQSDLDVLGDLAVAGERAMMRPSSRTVTANRCASPGSDVAPDVECRSRYPATCNGWIAKHHISPESAPRRRLVPPGLLRTQSLTRRANGASASCTAACGTKPSTTRTAHGTPTTTKSTSSLHRFQSWDVASEALGKPMIRRRCPGTSLGAYEGVEALRDGVEGTVKQVACVAEHLLDALDVRAGRRSADARPTAAAW
jgi:hypothetical protein